ncbi:hypothetical protein DYB28_013301 [Aphanomyces astaci]|uniref:Uncharacterized protein n=1 Tax=Aphanomyces astaci TaxID=112090 RepID=A0A9X8ECR3_APHAT|nr:hypothetical protein DYB28_013301 [Aphanomyces astaci]
MSTNVSDTNKTVEDALYCDDDDDDSSSISNPIKIELTPSQTWQTTDSKDNGAGLLSDIDLPNMLDMFNAMYADQTGAPLSTNTVDHHSTKFHPLSIHIPTPISIPQYQPLQPAAVTYQNTRLLAPNSTPNIHFTSPVHMYFCIELSCLGQVMASRLCCPKSKTPKALPRFTLSPDVAEQKLMRIFFLHCDPVTKCLKLPHLLTMLTKHRIKEDAPMNLSLLFPPNEITTTPFPQSLFRSESDMLSLEAFQSAFQICNRCTELKRKQYAVTPSSGGDASGPVVVSALSRDVMDDVAPVLVRVVPLTYEGPKIKSCDHFQWTWCEGFDKTGNEKCNGTNRHDKCPKYLANCTLWKHRLPPKNRKSKGPDDMDSPAKKLKFFS